MRRSFLSLALAALATAASFMLTLINLVPRAGVFRFTNEHPRSPLQSMRAGLA